ALPQYKVAKYKADYVKLETIVSSLADAAERYYLANGVYPARFDELDTEFPGAITTEYSTSTYSYRYYGNFPNEGYNLHVNSAGTVYATNQHNSFYIGLKYRQGAWGNCKVCRASSVDKASQTVCEQEAGTKNYQTTGAGSAASSYGLLSNNSMYSYFYQSYGQYAQ
ncbi:MAG: hypothetical protein MJ053_06630, partial [Elusimicrobiaceae bacterium]|nr:hypothetical protein [Elusimicrobiaceae bacterium]